jgi:heterodisulfide reductase subunit B
MQQNKYAIAVSNTAASIHCNYSCCNNKVKYHVIECLCNKCIYPNFEKETNIQENNKLVNSYFNDNDTLFSEQPLEKPTKYSIQENCALNFLQRSLDNSAIKSNALYSIGAFNTFEIDSYDINQDFENDFNQDF